VYALRKHRCILARLLVCRIIVMVPCGLYRGTDFCDVQEVALFIREQSNIFYFERIMLRSMALTLSIRMYAGNNTALEYFSI